MSCGPLGPGPGPSPSGSLAALMPLAWAAGLSFSPLSGSPASGFSGGTPAPAVAAATSSGGAASLAGGLSLPALAAGASSTLIGPSQDALAFASGAGPSLAAGLSFSPMGLGAGTTSLVLGPTQSALATASGAGPSLAAGVRFSPMPLGVSSTLVQGPTQLLAFSSGAGPSLAAGVRFSPMPLGVSSQGFQRQASAFVFNVTVTGGGNIPAQSGLTLTVSVPGVLATDAVYANQTSATFAAGVSISNSFASAANQITLEILNCTTSIQAIPTNFPLRVGVLRNP